VGNVNGLADVLISSAAIDREAFSKKIESHFEKEYSVSSGC
jgi:hypothetical protein